MAYYQVINNIIGSIERNTICSFLINGVARQGRFYKCRYTPADPPDPEEAYCIFRDNNNNLIYVDDEELNTIQKVPNVAAAAAAAGKRRKSRKQRKRRLHKTSRK